MKILLVLCLINGLTGELRECYSLTMQTWYRCDKEREVINQQNKNMVALCLDRVSFTELQKELEK